MTVFQHGVAAGSGRRPGERREREHEDERPESKGDCAHVCDIARES